MQPCGNPVGQLRNMSEKESVHRTLKKVKTQLRLAQTHLRMNLKDVHDVYSKVYKVLKEQYRMPWLPQKEFEWYAREVWCLEKGKKADRMLPHLYDSLQRIAITFHHLKEFRLKSNINVEHVMNIRNDMISQMYNEVLRALCEVETAISNLELKKPAGYTEKIVTESSNWAKEGDLTMMLIQDWGVIKLYQSFLNAWTKALRNATAVGSGICDRNSQTLWAKTVDKGSGPKPKRPRIKKRKNRPVRRKHVTIVGRNSSLPQRPKKGSPRRRLFRKKQKKLAGK